MLRNCFKPLAGQISEALENIVRDKNKGQIAQRPEFQVKPPFSFFCPFENVVVRNQQDQNSYQNEQDKKNVLGGAQ